MSHSARTYWAILGFISAQSRSEIPAFIQNLSGCFQVTYQYVEDLPNAPKEITNYQVQSKERIILQKSTDNDTHFRLVHWGFVGDPNKPTVVKHWENDFTLTGKDAAGNPTWHQRVYQVDGKTLRYECLAPAQTNRVATIRRCEANGTKMPQRHYSKGRHREDHPFHYDKLDRIHIYRVSVQGWSDVQRNTLRKKDGTALSTEMGWNEYRRITDAECPEVP